MRDRDCAGRVSSLFFFFFNDTATTEIYTLSLHDALPICDEALDLADHDGHAVVRRRPRRDRKSTRLNSSHDQISYAVFCLKKKTSSRCKPWAGSGHLSRRATVRSHSARAPGTSSRWGRCGGSGSRTWRAMFLFFLKERAPPDTSPFSRPAPLPT